mmetsp:Transcript_1650/g.2013  ORF Transcript_1650/g.2013 Transcript_1650/m.2013 type:complete len:96 (-) Transcript_1650:338-625(-)
MSEITFTACAKASSPSHSVNILTQFKQKENQNKQLLQRMRRTSSSSNPSEYVSLITLDEADTAAPGQSAASKHMQGIGHVDSHMPPGCRQRHPPN